MALIRVTMPTVGITDGTIGGLDSNVTLCMIIIVHTIDVIEIKVLANYWVTVTQPCMYSPGSGVLDVTEAG